MYTPSTKCSSMLRLILATYGLSARELATRMIRDVLENYGNHRDGRHRSELVPMQGRHGYRRQAFRARCPWCPHG
jgi:hypothetical protein